MKHSMIWRSAMREIRDSLGRFLAIFAIVALGVGLFSGLKITKADFMKSTTKYLRENAFYDYRILGTLGFSEKQVDFFAAQEDVVAAEGAMSFDAYYLEENGSRKVGKFHSLTQDVNKVVLVAGRLPREEGECLADSLYYGKNSLGRLITLAEENEDEELEHFAEREYKIVGIVKSPLYVQFERGNTSLGSGTVNAFFYLPKEAFNIDYYTEVYVKFRQEFGLYSEEYDAYLTNQKIKWEEIVSEASRQRFAELPAMIADAKLKLLESKNEARKELAEADAELQKAGEAIADGRREILDGKEEIQKGWKELDQARLELADARKTIADKEQEMEKGFADLERGQKEIEKNEKLISEKEAELTAGKAQVESAQMAAQLGEMQYKLVMEGLITEQKSIDSAKASLEERSRAVTLREEVAKSLGMEAAYAERIAKEREEIRKEEEALETQRKDLHQRYLEALGLGEQVENGQKELAEAQRQVKEGEEALKAGKEELLQGKKELLEAQKRLELGQEELRKAKDQIARGDKEIVEGEKTLKEKEKELEKGERELADAEEAYQEGLEEYQDGLREYREEVEKAEKAIGELQDRWESGEEPEGYLLGRNTNIGYVCFESDASIVDGIANVFPVFFFLVAALVSMTTMNRMVEEQRTQIGVLKALGYSDGRIMFKFLFYSGTAAISGAALGYAAGTHLFPFIIWTVYGIMYQAGPIAFTFNPVLAGISLLVAILCSVGTTYLSCRKELNSHAAQLMRPKAPKAGKRVFLELVPFLWKRLSFLRKVAIRNVVRYKKRFFMMVLGIGGCTGLLLTGFGIKDSIAGVAGMQFTEVETEDVSVSLQEAADEEFVGQLEALRESGLERFLIYQENSLDLVMGDRQKSVTVRTMPAGLSQQDFSEFLPLKTEKGEEIAAPREGEAVVTGKIARMLGISVGDLITLRDENMKEMHLKVSGIAVNYIYNYVYVEQTSWEKERGEKYAPKSFFVKVADGFEVGGLSTKIMRMDGVANVSVTQDVLNRFDTMMSSMNLIVVLVIFCAAGLAFVVLYNLTNINITERIREIATIKVLGFYPGETALYVFRENVLLTLLGSLMGLGMGKWLHAFVMHEINVDMVSFAVRIFPKSYLYAILLTFLFSMAVNLMMNRRLEEISMTESLKSVD